MGSVTRRTKATPAEERRPAIEAKLLEATERLLSDGTPYTELSIQQLCSEAGIARSTFYVYFRDKADLVARLAEEMVGQLGDAASKWWQPESTREELLASTRSVIDIYRAHGALFAALTETAVYDAEMRAMQVALVERNARPLAEMISAGKRDGRVREVHTEETVAALSWMLQGSCYHLALGADEAELDRIAEAVTGIIWHSIYPDRPARRRAR
jgi:AcrR family transcriptional regulator